MNIFTNSILTLKFITKVLAVNREKGAYHSYVKKAASYEIGKSHDLNDGSITKLDFLKIQWYMVTTLYLGELLTELRQNKLTKQEKKSLIYSGALMAITDIMVDDHQLGSEKLIALLSGETFDHEDLSSIENVFILYHNKLVSIISKKKVLTIQNFSLRKPHIESQSQLKTVLTEDEAINHTRKKGGTALLLTASLILDINEKNEAAIYQLGAFIQYMNDSQDIYKDVKAGITTFVSYCSTFDEVNKTLRREFRKTEELFHKTTYPEYGVYKLLFYLNGMYAGIAYKNTQFARITGNEIDRSLINKLDKEQFRINLFSLTSINYCLPGMLKFKIPAH